MFREFSSFERSVQAVLQLNGVHEHELVDPYSLLLSRMIFLDSLIKMNLWAIEMCGTSSCSGPGTGTMNIVDSPSSSTGTNRKGAIRSRSGTGPKNLGHAHL
jgi:hypothetical protein